MKHLTLIFMAAAILACSPSKKNKLNENETAMISKLTEITTESKFTAGSNGWEGYTGCKDPLERKAYSENIDQLLQRLVAAIEDKADRTRLESIITEHSMKAADIGEAYESDTDETEMNLMYFHRIKNICGVQ